MKCGTEKYRAWKREWYRNNREKEIKRLSKISNKKLDFVNKYKEKQGCIFCGENDPIVLDFHHINPKEKDFSISAYCRKKSIIDTKKEIKKCVVICSNCHRKLHANKLKLKA